MSDVTRRTAAAMVAAAAAITATPGATTGRDGMERVQGIGGFFFRAKDPKALAAWYETHLGVTGIPKDYNSQPWRQEAGATAFAPFAQDTTYFGAMTQMWMLNFRVADLDKMAAQLTAAGIAVKIDPETYPNGRFARLADPEGNPIELWQPKAG